MHKIIGFLLKVFIIVLGCALIYIMGIPLYKTLTFRISGVVVEGKIIGFRGNSMNSNKTILIDPSGHNEEVRNARRPVFKYPIRIGSQDSLVGFSDTKVLLPMFNFDYNDTVSVVMDKNNSSDAFIFSKGLIFMNVALVFFGMFMIWFVIKPRS